MVLLQYHLVILLLLHHFSVNNVNSGNNLKITYEYNNRFYMHYIYMPVEMVLLMTRNRHFREKSNISLSKNKTCESENSHKHQYENENEYMSKCSQSSNVIELYKYW